MIEDAGQAALRAAVRPEEIAVRPQRPGVFSVHAAGGPAARLQKPLHRLRALSLADREQQPLRGHASIGEGGEGRCHGNDLSNILIPASGPVIAPYLGSGHGIADLVLHGPASLVEGLPQAAGLI